LTEEAMNQIKRQKRNVSGWLVLNKPYDMTSTEAVGKVRWLFSAKKAGHAGTLDPLATGILPIALGEATKTVPNVQDGTKIYRFTMLWGASEAELLAVLPRFTGTITQVPPIFSAIKVDGERAYDLARAGEHVELAAREVTIETLTLLKHGEAQSEFEVTCQKGTYIRSLARDIAEALGTRGHVVVLHRAAVGAFSDSKAVTIAELEAADPAERDALLMPVSSALGAIPEIRLDPAQLTAIRHGNPVLLTGAGAPIALAEAWASFRGETVAIGNVEAGHFKPKRVIVPQ
jgi:tRNA pseudouridine55 synthase